MTKLFKIKRQDDPADLPYWEEFTVPVSDDATVLDALASIRENPATAEGHATTPVAFEACCGRGDCGACAMVVNGRAGLACEIKVDNLDEPVVLVPLGVFPVVRDLVVDRSRMFDALGHAMCWVGRGDLGSVDVALPTDLAKQKEFDAYRGCVMCGVCCEACPQVNERSQFVGAFIFSHILIYNRHMLGETDAADRLTFAAQRGGLSDCWFARNCEVLCPKGIALSGAVSLLAWDTTVHSVKRFLRG